MDNNNIDENKERVLLTFAGNTDPTRGNYDGPMLHICRYYRPKKIYLVLIISGLDTNITIKRM